MNVRSAVLLVTTVLSLAAAPVAASASPSPSADFLTPAVKTGDTLGSVFAKTTAITGSDFDPIVSRVSGSANDTITAVTPTAITEAEQYVYDGFSSGSDTVEVRDHGATNCVDGKCAPNDQTAAPLFNPLLWGPVPARIADGSTWNVVVTAPWEIGPAGRERVRVARLDPAAHLVTLVRRGDGTGPSRDDARPRKLKLTSKGRVLEVTLVPGASHWEGSATIARGITISDEIVLHRAVELVAATGERFRGEERIYTIFAQTP